MEDPSIGWTLEQDLIKVSGAATLDQALRSLGLVEPAQVSYVLKEGARGWYRGGAETYIYHFSVVGEGALEIHALLKACVAYAPAGNLTDILRTWIERRELLTRHGVATPRLYGHGHGLVVEEFVPLDLRDVLGHAKAEERDSLVADLLWYAAVLARMGFAGSDCFSDLRSRGRDVVVVDFGEDLGGSGHANVAEDLMFDQVLRYLRFCGCPAGQEDAARLRLRYRELASGRAS